MINSKDISIVIQGPIYSDENGFSTNTVIESYRRHFPNSEIIFSTWQDVSGLDMNLISRLQVTLVQTQDPGPDSAGDVTFNLNRQLISTARGLAKSTKPYLIKTRSDASIDSHLMLQYYELHTKVNPSGYIFSAPILIYSLSTRNWHKGFIPHYFHPCDWFFFGKSRDIKSLFDGNLFSRENLAYFNYFKKPRRPSFSGTAQYTPEQWILVDYLLRRGFLINTDFANYSGNSRRAALLNSKIFKEDFLVLDNDQIGLYSPKYPHPHSYETQISQLRHEEWVQYTKQRHFPSYQRKYTYRTYRLLILSAMSFYGTTLFLMKKLRVRTSVFSNGQSS